MVFWLIRWWRHTPNDVLESWVNTPNDINRDGVRYASKKFNIILPRWTIQTADIVPLDAVGATVTRVNKDITELSYRYLETETIVGNVHNIRTTAWSFGATGDDERVISRRCPFKYRGVNCGWDGPGFTIDGQPTTKQGPEDVCARTSFSCIIRFGTLDFPYGGVVF